MTYANDSTYYMNVEYYPCGAMRSYIPITTEWFQVGKDFISTQSGAPVELYQNGNLKKIYSANNVKVTIDKYKLKLRRGEAVEFDKHGRIKNVSLSSTRILSEYFSGLF